MKPQHHNLSGVVQHLLKQQRVLRPDQGVPVVGHQYVAAEQKSQPSPRSLQHVDEQRVFRFVESPDPRAKVYVDEENTVREAQAVHVRHARRLPPRPNAFNDRDEKNPRTEKHCPWLPASSYRQEEVMTFCLNW
jgi:hypothetical protein